MSRFSFDQLLAATGARRVQGDPAREFSGVSTDSRSLESGQLFLALSGPNFDGNRFAADALARGAAGLLLREDDADDADELTGFGEGLAVATVPDPRRALADLASWYRGQLSADVIGITGSCGKTTTKNMLVELLRDRRSTVGSPASFNNDVGLPHSLLLAQPDTQALVLEIGTNAPGEIAALCEVARPTAGILTGIGACHLAGLGSMEGVAEEKAALIEAVPAEGFVVLNADCRFTPSLRERARARVITFGLDGAGDLSATDLTFQPGGTSFLLNGERQVHLPLLGQHMVQNLLAALAACHGLGLDAEQVLHAVARMQDGRGRLQRRVIDGVLVIDDSYNANPESVRASVRVLAGLTGHARRALVLGDMHELGERSTELHREIGADIADAGLDLLVTVGPRARAVAEGALNGGMDAARVHVAPDLDAAQLALSDRIADGDVLLVKGSRASGLEGLIARLEEARPSGVDESKRREEVLGT